MKGQQLTLSARSVQTGITTLGMLAFGYSSWRVATAPISIEWLLLSVATIALVSRVDIGIPRSPSYVTLSDAFIFSSVFVFGTHPAVLLAGVDAAVSALRHTRLKGVILLNLAVMSGSILVSSEAVTYLFGGTIAPQSELGDLLKAIGSLALFHYVLNAGAICVITALRQRRSVLVTWKESFLWASLSYFAGAIAAAFIVKLLAVISFTAFIIGLPILAITYFTYKVYLDRIEASQRHSEELAELHLRTIEALAIAIDAKDEVTHDHVRRVQIYSGGLARLFGLTDGEMEALKAGSLLHDVGKLAVPDYILNKPGALTPAELDKMKVHTIVGAEILERVGFPYPAVPVVRHHHERWDGRGYPDGLKGDQIPITARILAVSDCFDAAQEDRQYRKALTREQAIQMLKDGAGTVFDPTVVSTFLDHLDYFEAEIRDQGVARPPAGVRNRQPAQSRPDSGPRVFEQIRSAHREVITLYNIAQLIGTSLDLRDTFAVFSSRLNDIVRYTTCVMYLLRTETNEIEAAHAVGRHADRLRGKKMNAGSGVAGWVVANRHPMHNCDSRLDFDMLKADITDEYRAATAVPLIKDDEVLGALALYSTEMNRYEPDHLRLVEAVAKLASDAVANAVRHERTENTALTDALTGLPNARALRLRFQEEVDQARRHRDVFCVVMMDIDGLKAVNDTLGHHAGDGLLKDMARLLVRLSRSADFVCRYAGDEFVAIVHVGGDEAKEMLNRIQVVVDKHDFGVKRELVNVGVSAGLGAFGVDGESLDELLLAADRAMYADKARRKAAYDSSGPKPPDSGQYTVM